MRVVACACVSDSGQGTRVVVKSCSWAVETGDPLGVGDLVCACCAVSREVRAFFL